MIEQKSFSSIDSFDHYLHGILLIASGDNSSASFVLNNASNIFPISEGGLVNRIQGKEFSCSWLKKVTTLNNGGLESSKALYRAITFGDLGEELIKRELFLMGYATCSTASAGILEFLLGNRYTAVQRKEAIIEDIGFLGKFVKYGLYNPTPCLIGTSLFSILEYCLDDVDKAIARKNMIRNSFDSYNGNILLDPQKRNYEECVNLSVALMESIVGKNGNFPEVSKTRDFNLDFKSKDGVKVQPLTESLLYSLLNSEQSLKNVIDTKKKNE